MNSEKHLLQQVRRSKIQKYLKQQLCRMRRKGRYCIAYAVSSFSAVSSGQYTFFSRSAILQQTFIQIGRDRSFIDYLSFPVSRDGTVVGRVPVLFLPFEIRFSGLEKKAAGRQVLCTHRRVTPALGARLLRSYVPLRYGPSERGCANNTCLPADTLPVRKFEFILQVLTAVLSDTPSPPILSAVHPVSLHWWTMCCGAVRWRRDGSARGVCRKLLP